MNVNHTTFQYTPEIPTEVLSKEARSYQYQTDTEQTHFSDHIEHSFKHFSQSIPTTCKSALLIGPGHCRDIPLASLKACKDIILLDIDPECLDACKKEPALNSDITFWQEDFTVRGGDLIQSIYATKSFSRLQATLTITDILKKACQEPLKDPFPSQTYDFIAATVVLSQVNCLLSRAIHQVLPKQAQAEMMHLSDSLEKKALQQMFYTVKEYAIIQQIYLLNFMYERLKDSGTLFLSMTPILTEQKIDPETKQALKQIKYPLINLPRIDKEIDKRFTQKAPRNVWQWTATKATKEMRWIERIFTVQARALQKKR